MDGWMDGWMVNEWMDRMDGWMDELWYFSSNAKLHSLNCPPLSLSFIHSCHFYSALSSPLLPRGAPEYSTDTVSEFHAEAHRQLQVKDLPNAPTRGA